MNIRLENPPKYKIGQKVSIFIETTHASSEKVFKIKTEGLISSIAASGTDVKNTYLYEIRDSLPGCYYAGGVVLGKILEDNIVLIEE